MSKYLLRVTLFVCLALPVFLLSGCGGSSAPTSGGSGGTAPVVTPTPALTPTVTAVVPATVMAGSAATSITVNGTNFTAATAIQIGGVLQPTTFVSSTQLSATVPAAQLAAGALLPVIVLNGTATSASGAPVNLEIDNPSPAISLFAPDHFFAGGSPFSVLVTGTGFVPTTAIQVNGAARGTTFISGTELSVLLSSADLATAGSLSLTAVNGAPGGGTSAAASLPVNNPQPNVMNVMPQTVPAGGTSPATLTITGSGFLPITTVLVGTTSRPVTYVSPTQLTVALTVADQAAPGRLQVTVKNPAPGGGMSFTFSVLVVVPTLTPTITSVNPTSYVVGSPNSTLTVQGTNFTTGTVVQWNGTALQTFTFIGNGITSLSATVPASLLSTVGTATVTASSPSAANPLSNAVQVSITNPPVPTLTALSPNSGPIQTSAKISLTGTGFTQNTTAAFNGLSLTTTYVSPTQLTVTLPATAIALPGNGNFTVSTPAPGGGTSAPRLFTAYIPLTSNSMIFNPVDGLIYASIPGSVGAPLGNSIVSVDPATGAIGTPIPVGSEPNKLALTADGKFLWVTLDGSVAVRKIDLTAKTAGLQFSPASKNSGIYNNPGPIEAIAALPGATDSVVVYESNGFGSATFGIFDSGVLRGSSVVQTSFYTNVYALQTDSTRNEIYAGGPNYGTYKYNAAGLTALATNNATAPATNNNDEILVQSGKLYTDQGKVYDAESGVLLGTLYLAGTTVAQGTTVADSTTGKIFTLDSSSSFAFNSPDQIQVFKDTDYTTAGSIPVNVSAPAGFQGASYPFVTPTRLTRWGSNGLVFHTPYGIYSLHSDAVVDLSSTSADLGVTATSSGSTITGTATTFTVKVTNSGPSTAADVALSLQPPNTGTTLTATASTGTCTVTVSVSCSLGSIANSATVNVVVTYLQATAGASTLTAQVSASTADPAPANNTASVTATITGNTYSPVPVVSALSPAAIQSGSTDTQLTVNGTGFVSGSSILLDGAVLPTSFVSATQLSATVPAAKLANLGWSSVTVTSPSPGGGSSAAVPLSVYSVISLGVNHIVYDPFSRQIMASVGSGSSTVTGNSIVAITPETASVGAPVSIGSQPTSLALSSDGQILYTILSGSASVARFNMLTRQADFTYTPPVNSSIIGGIVPRGIAVQPGTEDTIALDLASFSGNAIYDFNPVKKTATIRGQASGPYSGSCIQFLDAGDLLAFDVDTSGASLDHYTVTSAGFTYYNYSQYSVSSLNRFGCFKLSGGLAFANAGGIANPATVPATQVATLPNTFSGGGFSTFNAFVPDVDLRRSFYGAVTSTGNAADGVAAYDLSTYLLSGMLSLNMTKTEGGSTYSQVDMIRWGQDGLAVLTSGGHIYLLRGPVVAPQLLNTNAAATLTSLPVFSAAHGSGNLTLTLAGSGFVPGVAVQWNGAYRTTTMVDASHLSFAVPASDLATAGNASITVVNPGASASGSLTFTIN